MYKDSAKNLVTKYIENVWNNADMETFDELTSKTYTYHLGGQPAKDRTAMKEFLQMVHSAFPDWKVQIKNMVSQGNGVAIRWSGKVTHQGIFHGLPATGRQIFVTGINMHTIENGKISREWEQMDSLGMLQQLGVLPQSENGNK